MKACLLSFLVFFQLTTKAQDTKSSFSNNGVQISYSTIGQGKPLLVANGGPGFSSHHMLGFANEMAAKGFKVILFDQRGTGKSSLPSFDSLNLTLDLVLADMLKLVDVLGYKSVAVMGHSFGGILAMSFAAKYPEKVDKLILSSSAGINLDFLNYFGDNIFQRLEKVETDTLRPTTVKEREESFYRQVSRNAPAYFFNKENVKPFIDMLTIPGSYSPDYNLMMWTDLFRINYDLSRKMKKFKRPALVIQGRQDILGDETAIRIHEAIKQSKLEFINRCGHVPWMDAPEQFYGLLTQFLNA